MRFDALVIGSGIAGSNIAYFLADRGLKVGVIEKDSIACGASGAAGAFLSPMTGKGALVDFVNKSLKFALDFYAKIAPDLLIKNGALRFAKKLESIDEFYRDAELINLPSFRVGQGVFFDDAGAIDAKKLCQRLLEKCTVFEHAKADRPKLINGEWHAAGHSAKILVCAIGAYESILPDWWLKLRGVWGERLLIKPAKTIAHNYMGDVAISASFHDSTAAIGATHKRAKTDWTIDPNADRDLREKAALILPEIVDAKTLEIKGGMRPASVDYMPIAGELIDAHKILKDFPNMPNGGHISETDFSYYHNLYIFTGHGGRGFVTAPKTASDLADEIVNKKRTKIGTDRFVLRAFRRDLKLSGYDALAQNPPLER